MARHKIGGRVGVLGGEERAQNIQETKEKEGMMALRRFSRAGAMVVVAAYDKVKELFGILSGMAPPECPPAVHHSATISTQLQR